MLRKCSAGWATEMGESNTWRPLDLAEDGDFSAQYNPVTNTLGNIWLTIMVTPRTRMTDEEMIALVARLETAAGDDLA